MITKIMAGLLNLWHALLRRVGLMTIRQHDQVAEAIRNLYLAQLDGEKERIGNLVKELDAMSGWCDTYLREKTDAERLCAATRQRLDEALRENERIKGTIELYKHTGDDNLEYVKGLQKQLSEVLYESQAFAFPDSHPIPGSVSVRTDNVTKDDTDFVVFRSRAIVSDYLTAEINEAPDMTTRVNLVLNDLRGRGFFTKLADKLLRNGGISLILAYNPRCTNYELYTEVVAKNCAKGSLMTILDRDEVYTPEANPYTANMTTVIINPDGTTSESAVRWVPVNSGN